MAIVCFSTAYRSKSDTSTETFPASIFERSRTSCIRNRRVCAESSIVSSVPPVPRKLRPLQQVQHPDDPVERGPHLVAHVRQKPVFSPVRLLSARPGDREFLQERRYIEGKNDEANNRPIPRESLFCQYGLKWIAAPKATCRRPRLQRGISCRIGIHSRRSPTAVRHIKAPLRRPRRRYRSMWCSDHQRFQTSTDGGDLEINGDEDKQADGEKNVEPAHPEETASSTSRCPSWCTDQNR